MGASMIVPPAPKVADLAPMLVRRLYDRADAARWGLTESVFEASLRRSLARRFRGVLPSGREVEEYLEGLHVKDLALACACAHGNDVAWEHFVQAYRPALLAAATSVGGGSGRDLADSIYADLFGTEERDGARRSLFDYYHGRCSLTGWLRAVLAQRAVDRARASRRLEPLPEPGTPGEPSVPAIPPDVDRARQLTVVRTALTAALHALSARDRLRLSLYYARELKLAAVGRVLGESEATVSRRLARCRADLRLAVERRLRDRHGMDDAQVKDVFDVACGDPAFDLARALEEG